MITTFNTTANTSVISKAERLQYLKELQDKTTITFIPAMTFLVIIAATGVIGNTIILFVYYRKFKKNALRILIMAIAVFDFFANVLAIPGDIYHMFHRWDFDNALICQMRLFSTSFATLSPAFALVAVAVIRYRKVCKPYEWQVSISQAKIIIVIIVLFGVICSVPYVITNGRHTKETPKAGILGVDCNEDDSYKDTIWPTINNGFFLLLYLLCTIPLTIMYIKIGTTARKSKQFCQVCKTASVIVNNKNINLPELHRYDNDVLDSQMPVKARVPRPSVDSAVTVCDVINKDTLCSKFVIERFKKRYSHILELDKDPSLEETTAKGVDDDSKNITKTKHKDSTLYKSIHETRNKQENDNFNRLNVRSTLYKSNFGSHSTSKLEELVCKDNRVENKASCNKKDPRKLIDNMKEDNFIDDDENIYLINDKVALKEPHRGKKRRSESTLLKGNRHSSPALFTNWRNVDFGESSLDSRKIMSLRGLREQENSPPCDDIKETDVDEVAPIKNSKIFVSNIKITQIIITSNVDSTGEMTLGGLTDGKEHNLITNGDCESIRVARIEDSVNNNFKNKEYIHTAEGCSTNKCCDNSSNIGIKSHVKARKENGNIKHFNYKRWRYGKDLLGRTTAILIIISAVYAIGFLPYIALSFFTFIAPAEYKNLTIVELSFYNLFRRFYFINSAANPIIYSLCGGKFRRECLNLLRCKS